MTPEAQELFEKYSNVDSARVKAHIKELVRLDLCQSTKARLTRISEIEHMLW